jgi:D-alanyl-D-alanine carboxypeptidase
MSAARSGPQSESARRIGEHLPAAIETLRAALNAPGATAAIVLPDGSTLIGASGLGDVEEQAPMSPSARMPGGSTGKTIAAATAISLVEQGVLALDEPMSRLMRHESWWPRLPNANNITLRMALSHSGGIPDHMGYPSTLERLISLRERDPDDFLTPRQCVEIILDRPPIVPAGGGFFYSDTSYILVGLLIEIATGHVFYDEAQKRILTPLGLSDFESATKRNFARLVAGYTDAPDTLRLPRKTSDEEGRLVYSPASEWTGGGYVTSSKDLARLMWSYPSGRLLGQNSLEQIRKIERFSWNPGQVGGYGLGLFATMSVLGPTWGHGGYYPGYRSQALYFPDLDIAAAYQVNSSQHFGGYAKIVANREAAAVKPIAKDAPLTVANDPLVDFVRAVLKH